MSGIEREIIWEIFVIVLLGGKSIRVCCWNLKSTSVPGVLFPAGGFVPKGFNPVGFNEAPTHVPPICFRFLKSLYDYAIFEILKIHDILYFKHQFSNHGYIDLAVKF